MDEFSVTTERLDDGTVVLAVTGEVDLATAPEFDRWLAAALGNGVARVIVDLTFCDFLDSAGLNALANAKRHLDGSPTLSLIVAPGTIPHKALDVGPRQVVPVEGFQPL